MILVNLVTLNCILKQNCFECVNFSWYHDEYPIYKTVFVLFKLYLTIILILIILVSISPIALPSGSQLNEDFAGSIAVASGFGLTSDGMRYYYNLEK